MKKNQYYAVVDLETTGSSFKDGDRIIQIGIALIQNGQIVQSYETKVNPGKKISPTIQHITGITNQMVANAPYFEDIAGYVYPLLEGCIFVAHNILFDYRFMSDEFERAGLPPLKLKAIDTVQLSQILLPSSPTFSLGELAETMGIRLDNPHDALHDATATAELFLILKEKALRLPLVTLEKLADLSSHCLMDTSLFFIDCLNQALKSMTDLPDDLFVQNKIAFRRAPISKHVHLHPRDEEYPQNEEQKRHILQQEKRYRKHQAQIMDEIYQYFSDENPDHHHLAIEAPAGVGKTFGYLFPSAYYSADTKPIVISTYTTLLQQQIIDKEMASLQELLPFDVSFSVLKSSYHYLDVRKWKAIMDKKDVEKAEALYSMRILVWLTQTVTGDLDELNIKGDAHRFWEEVRHKNQPVYQKIKEENIDFYSLSRSRAAASTFIVTNHSYLAHQWMKERSDFPSFSKLIVDEAHRFPDAAQKASTKTFHTAYLTLKIRFAGAPQNEQTLLHRLYEHFGQEDLLSYDWRLLDQLYFYLMEELTDYSEELFFYLNQIRQQNEQEGITQSFEPDQLPMRLKKQAKGLSLSLFEYISAVFRLIDRLLPLSEEITSEIRLILDELFDALTIMMEQREVLAALQPTDRPVSGYFWSRYEYKKGAGTLSIHFYNGEEKNAVLQKLQHVPHVVYVSGTLGIDDNFRFFEKRIDNENIKKIHVSSDYTYEEQTRVFVPENLPQIKTLSPKSHARLIADVVVQCAKKTNENVLVLFTSHETLRETHRLLMKSSSLAGRELLAQSISGTREKIAKRFSRSQGGILLGAESFWEGLDLPGAALRVVIVTRLPFEFPDRPLIKARNAWLEKNQLNSFAVDALPRAALRLKQSYGRLLRSSEDKGVFILLDNRIFSSAYGSFLQKAFPDEVPIEVKPLSKIMNECQDFFEK